MIEVHSIYQQEKRRQRFVCVVSLYVAERPKASIKDQESPLPIILFGIVAYRFVGQPFSKQLYTAVSTKVVPQKRKSVRDNADWYYG